MTVHSSLFDYRRQIVFLKEKLSASNKVFLESIFSNSRTNERTVSNEPPIYDIATANSRMTAERSQSSGQQTATARSTTLLQRQGILENGDSVFARDGSLYDVYTFEGRASQSVSITVRSSEFDPYLALIGPDGKKVAENDDISESDRNSALTVTLPRTGRYIVFVNGYERNGRGRYTVTVNAADQQTATARSSNSNSGQQTTTGRSSNSNSGQQTVTGRSSNSGQQTTTGRVSNPRQVYRNVRELGIAQFVHGNQELKSSQEKLQAASKSQYTTNIDAQNIDFLKQEITEIRPADCRAYGYSCERRKINYGDYISLRIKVKLQTNVFSHGMNFYEEVRKYNDRLDKDNRYGGKAVADKIVSEFNRIWNNLEAQQQRRDSQATLSVPQRLITALDQTREDVGEFSVSVFKTSAKVLATVTQIKDLSETITSLRSINPETLNRVAGAPKYILVVTQILKDSGEAFLSFDSEKLRDNTLKAAQETIELVNAQDQRVAGSGNVIKAYLAARELIDKDKLLRQPEVTNSIDEFDKFYLAAAQFSKAIDVIIAGLSIPFSEIKVVDTLVKKADAVNILLFDALEFSYKSDVRRKYMRWEYYYNRNQIAISGLSSFIDYAAQEVGEYLVRARTDVVTRRSDGTIAVSIDGVLYPP